jgi:hypothetical protein
VLVSDLTKHRNLRHDPSSKIILSDLEPDVVRHEKGFAPKGLKINIGPDLFLLFANLLLYRTVLCTFDLQGRIC